MRWLRVAIGITVGMPAAVLVAQESPPAVNVRIDGEPWLAPGEVASARYFAEAGSYVAVLQVGVDGDVRVLVPDRGRQQRRMASSDELGVRFQAERGYGTGAIVSVASRTPLDLVQVRGTDDDWRRVVAPLEEEGDAGVRRLARLMAGPRASYDVTYAEYYVGRRSVADDGVRYESYDSYLYEPYGWYGGFGIGRGRAHRDDDWRWRRPRDGRGADRIRDGRGRFLRPCPDGTLVPETTPCPTAQDRRLVIPKPTPAPRVPEGHQAPRGRERTPERRPR